MSFHCKIGGPWGSSALVDDLSRGSLDMDEDRAALEHANPPDYLHLDITDGQFVPASVASGSETVKALRDRFPNTFLDVHMMINEPEKRVDEMASAGASQFTFHLEAANNPTAVIEHVRRKGMKVGLGLKPTTPVEDALPYAAEVDSVLILTVEPCSISSRSNQTLTQTDKNSLMQKIRTLQEACPGLDVKTDGWDETSVMQHPTPVTRSKVEDMATPTLLSSPRSAPPATANNSTTADQRLHQNGETAVTTHSSSKTPLLQAQQGGGGTRINSNAAVPSYGSLQTYESADNAFRVSDPYDKGGSSYLVVPPELEQQSPDESIRCECHAKVVDKTAKRAKIKLVLASIIALGFMAGEVVGGYFAGSLAIMTDAAHMLSDFAGFLISLFAIWLGSRPSSNKMSFGWHRAEVMGAVVSVLIIWVITGVLFYEAVQRVIHPITIDADIMLITACVGVFVNVFMCMVLHPHSHGHNHGASDHKKKKNLLLEDSRNEEKGEVSGSGRRKRRFWQRKSQQHNKHGSEENINVRAAFIHVIGDLIQSIGVVIAGYIIKFKPSWTIVDPICTFIFCILVLISTLNVLKDALRVLMEGTPKHIDYTELKEDLEDVSGVRKAHSLHIWSLTVNKTALAAHLVTEPSANHQSVLNEASQMLKERYNIISTTLQVEDHHDLMEECGTCQETDKAEFCNFTCWPL